MVRHQARKRFGQNFLIDDQIIHQISSIYAEPVAAEHKLIEIGPGRGALTDALLRQGQALTALELDRDLIPILETKFSHYPDFTLKQGDALQTDFIELGNGMPLRLVGNLPYNVATPLIFILLEHVEHIIDLHFMLQWEVVARLSAQPGDQHYGQLSVVVQNVCQANALFEVPPQAFSPVPKVQSGFISLVPRATPLVEKKLHDTFNHIVKTSFTHRRKTLRNNLKGLLDSEQITAAGIDPGARAETLAIQDYAALASLVFEQS